MLAMAYVIFYEGYEMKDMVKLCIQIRDTFILYIKKG